MTTKLNMAQKPFSEGAFRYAFEGQDTMLNEKLVLKLNKKINVDEYDLKSLS
jgi:hypothetical protein